MKNNLRTPPIALIVAGAMLLVLVGTGIALIVHFSAHADKNDAKDKTTYAIHFDANGGTGSMNDQIVSQGTAVALTTNAFTRMECSFAGWNTKADGTGTTYSDKANVKDMVVAGGKTTLYAQWKALTYTVHYSANGGQGQMNDQVVFRTKSDTLSANMFTREDYTFVCWNTKANGTGKTYANSENIKDAANAGDTLTLFAQWKAQAYTIHFYANGGTGTMNDQIVERNASVKLMANAFKRDNFDFAGWNTKADGTGIFYKDHQSVKDLETAGGKVTLFAQWKMQTYIIRFDANGCSGSMTDQVANRGAVVNLQANALTREDYSFAGWNSEEDGSGTAYPDKASVKDLAESGESTTLYAQWKKQTYIIRYNGNGGFGIMADQTVERGTETELTANTFVRANCDFAGWNTMPDGTGAAYGNSATVKNLTNSGNTITLYAQWRLKTYTIRYDCNGGAGSMSEQNVDLGTSVNLAANAFTREHFDFTGWNTKPDGTGDDYSAGESVKDLAEAGETVTLFAQWKIQTYTIRFEANNGMGLMEDMTVNMDETVTLSPNEFVRENHKFTGWNTKPDGSGESYADIAEITNLGGAGQTVTLYAQWIIQLMDC